MCAFGNQVEIDASSAKFGKRSASMLPSGRRRSSLGNSSNTTTTTGGRRLRGLRLLALTGELSNPAVRRARRPAQLRASNAILPPPSTSSTSTVFRPSRRDASGTMTE